MDMDMDMDMVNGVWCVYVIYGFLSETREGGYTRYTCYFKARENA